jgi:hypothetical protein
MEYDDDNTIKYVVEIALLNELITNNNDKDIISVKGIAFLGIMYKSFKLYFDL